jgi:very-short-patch-repair endonuclease
MRGANVKRTARAQRLRSNSTIAESRLWNRLRSRAVNGFKFVRQEPIGPYVVDFVCRERRLVIEIDGGQHADSKRDQIRDSWLKEHNYQVLRFWNNDVLRNTNGVLEVIAQSLRVESPPPPTPLSALGGRPLPASGER